MDKSVIEDDATLEYRDRLPLLWRTIAEEEWSPARANEGNEALLRVLSGIEEYHPYQQEDGPSGMADDLERLEMKIDFLMDLMVDILSRESPPPPPVDLSFSGTGMSWAVDGAPPEPGRAIAIDLHVSSRIPRPLRLKGRVREGGAGCVTVVFEEMSPAVKNGLERLVFRRHRRAVAQSRG